MLAINVERMMFIRLNKHMVDEVSDWDAAKAKAKARVVKSAKLWRRRSRRGQAWWLTFPCRCHGIFIFLYDDEVQVTTVNTQ